MQAIGNEMKESEKHKDYDFLNQQIERPFTTPEGYFDTVEKNILSTINSPKAKINFINSELVKYAAAAILILGIFLTILYIHKNEINPNKQIIVKEDKGSKIQPKVGSDKKLNAMDNSPDENNSVMSHPSKAQQINLKQSQKQENKEDIKLVKQQNQENKETFQGQIPYNQLPNTSPIYSQHISNGSGSTATNGVDVARTQKKANEKVIKLPYDTCSVSPVVLVPIKDEIQQKKYSYYWSTGEQTAFIKAYNSGEYTVFIYQKGEKNPIDSQEVKFNLAAYPQPYLGPDQTYCSYESIELNCNSYDLNYKYKWSIGNSESSKLFIPRLSAGVHTIKVEIEACGIKAYDEIILTINECILEFSNVITPNSDGKNDYFSIKGLENYPGSKLYIMDRSGKVIYESLDYHNDWNGDNYPEGTYFYLLKINDKEKSERGGSLTILR